jgi:hypothetical protein
MSVLPDNNTNDSGYDIDEEEDECRVCRGPAEEGYGITAVFNSSFPFPLFLRH